MNDTDLPMTLIRVVRRYNKDINHELDKEKYGQNRPYVIEAIEKELVRLKDVMDFLDRAEAARSNLIDGDVWVKYNPGQEVINPREGYND